MYQNLAREGLIKLIYVDESGFSGDLPVNYSWTKKGKQKHVNKINAKGTKLNVLGFLDYADDKLTYSLTQDKMDSEMFISLFDITKPKSDVPVCIVIDNCSIHKSKITKKKITEWEKKGIFFYFITPYSPELNLIENKWNKLKYHSMPKRYFNNSSDLKLAIEQGIAKLNYKT